MRSDEVQLLAGEDVVIHPKRLRYLKHKWNNKGLTLRGEWTSKGLSMIECIKKTHNDWHYLDKLDHHVCILHTINWMPPVCGILQDCGDNGIYFYTTKSSVRNSSYYLGESHNMDKGVAFVERHPNPAKLWRKYNYIAYLQDPKYNKDYWHMKYSDWGYNRPPAGHQVGECMPCCQCKSL